MLDEIYSNLFSLPFSKLVIWRSSGSNRSLTLKGLGEGHFAPPPSGFFHIAQKRAEIFQRNFSCSLSITKDVWPYKKFLIRPYILGGKDPKKGQILVLLIFS